MAHRLPLDRESLAPEKLGVKLTKLTKEQAEYIRVPVEGPYKPEHHKY